MEKQKKVIDASILAKWFLNEQDSEKARSIRKEHLEENTIIIIPELAILEVINVLKYKGGTEKELDIVNNVLWNTELKIERTTQQILKKAIENSIKYDITLYDSLYVAISQLYGSVLITSDSELFKIPNVIPLDKI